MNRGLGRLGIGALIAWASVAGPASAAADGTVWASGRFGERPIEAVLQPAGTRLVGRAAACAGCHGAEAEGGGEGVRAPALVHRGRLRRGLDSASLARALEAGIGLDGRPLHPAMPRYLLQPGMAAVLVQELEEIGRRSVEGVETDRIVLATVWPDRTGIAPVRAVVARFRTLLEREGGIFGRRLELVELPVEPRQAAARLAARPALALLLDDAPEALLAPLRGRGWPELFPLRPADGDEPATVRRLGPARPVEARALLDAAIADLGGRGRIRLLAPPALAAELEVPITRAPNILANCRAKIDTPPTRSSCSGGRRNRSPPGGSTRRSICWPGSPRPTWPAPRRWWRATRAHFRRARPRPRPGRTSCWVRTSRRPPHATRPLPC